MKRLGISIYPDKSDVDQLIKYLDLASKYNVKRVFSCLLSAPQDDDTIDKYKKVYNYAKSLNMDIIVDVMPSLFDDFNITYEDLSFFKELGVAGFRLDESFDGIKEAAMSFNEEGLIVELNASIPSKYLDLIMSFSANKNKLSMCHNFYPQKYTGLGLDLFNKCNEDIKKHNIPISAFVCSQNEGAFGPWGFKEGLPTLEMHRELDIDLQVRHFVAIGDIEDIIISNCYATEEEFKSIYNVSHDFLQFKIEESEKNSEIEKEIIYDFKHHVRGDMSDYMVRSTWPRVKYKNSNILPNDTRDLRRGDVIIINDNYGKYKGELHIVMKDMKNDGNKNVVGRIKEEELFLLQYIKPWRRFGFLK